MVENKVELPAKYDMNAKWDACLDLTVRRFVYSSFAGGFTGLLLFRSPTARWVSVGLGVGLGLGSAYSECAHILNTSPTNLTRNISATPLPKAGDE